MRKLLVLVGLLVCVGCKAPPPKVLDATPRFRVGQERTEGIQAFAELETIVKDVPTHFGLMWEAKVVSVGDQGLSAEIDAKIVRVVAQLPGGVMTIDTESLIPLGRITGLGRFLFKLIGLGFHYSVGPTGDVRLSGWSEAVDSAATEAGEKLPGDGTVPPSEVLQDALARVYHSPPRRKIRLKETWTQPETYHLSTADGPEVRGVSHFAYLGMSDQEFEFGTDEVTLEGASVRFSGQADVTKAGTTLFGVVPAQQGPRRGKLLWSRDGSQLLMYRELDELKIEPSLEILGGIEVPVEVASFKTGWVFFAEAPWE
jgi:hypothetical protein